MSCRHSDDETPPEDCCDVYLGRGGEINKKRQGSLYGVLLKKKFEEYSRTLPSKKRNFAWKNIIVPIHKNGGKFFAKSGVGDSHGWEEAKTDQVFKAVMQALRDRKRTTNMPSSLSCEEISSSTAMSPPPAEASGMYTEIHVPDSCMSMETSPRRTTGKTELEESAPETNSENTNNNGDNKTANPTAIAVITSSSDEARIYGMSSFRCRCCHHGGDPPCITTRMLQHLQELVSSLRRENVTLHQACLEPRGERRFTEDTGDGGD